MGQNITWEGWGVIDSDSSFLKGKPINLIDLKKNVKNYCYSIHNLDVMLRIRYVQCPLTNRHHFGCHFPPEQNQRVHCELWKIYAFILSLHILNPHSDKL